MAVYRITASVDNTITNAYGENLTTRGTGSNMGASDILEVFSIYGQVTPTSTEFARTLVQFPLDTISTKRTAGTLPASGSVDWYLKLYNAKHVDSVPKDFNFFVLPVSSSWQEGVGLDMEDYSDVTYDSTGSNWIQARHSASHDDDGKWTTAGGDYLFSEAVTASFSTGLEDMEVNVSDIVEDWVKAFPTEYNNYGFGILLDPAQTSHAKSYYTKKFFGRGTEFYFKQPILEARWDDSKKDDRGDFYMSSSLAPAADNLNTLYLYNYIKGNLVNIPSVGEDAIYLSIYSGSADNSEPADSPLDMVIDGANVSTNLPNVVTGSYVSKGVYKATFAFTGSSTMTKIYDVWFSGSETLSSAEGAMQFHTGAISLNSFSATVEDSDSKYVVSILNNNHEYHREQTARFKLYTRLKNWSPNLYTTAQSTPENVTIEDALYKIFRVSDGTIIIDYSSGSVKHTQLSYNVSGNYFDLDMSMFEPNYQYGIKLSFYNSYLSSYIEQPYIFKFRVVD